MTKKLEELLNLPENKDVVETPKAPVVKSEAEEAFDAMAEFDKIAAALPKVSGLGHKADAELDNIADKAMNTYEELMNLGMNVESRYSGRIFEVAGGLLKTSLDAKTAKLDKKLKMIELQLKKQKMDQDSNSEDDDTFIGEGKVVTDRNSLLNKLRNIDK